MVDDKEPEVAAAAVVGAPATEEETKPTEKPVKEKKPRVPKEKKPKQPKTASHPPYFQVCHMFWLTYFYGVVENLRLCLKSF